MPLNKPCPNNHFKQFFAFVAWPLFFNTHSDQLFDQMKLQIALSKKADCSQIQYTSTTIIAHSTEGKIKGLSGKERKLGKDESMLFIYDDVHQLTFWMKETYIPLQIAFFDGDGLMGDIFEMPVEADPSNPFHFYTSSSSAMTALEMKPHTLPSNQKLFLCIENSIQSDSNKK